MDKEPVTVNGLEKLKKELDHLKNVKRPNIITAIAEARSNGELKITCDRHNKKYYIKYKNWCDKYFYLNHRKEMRGVGGIFFDYKKYNWNKDFSFVKDVGNTFTYIFKKIIKRKMFNKWTIKEKEIQLLKRGRYVEFNLLYDRGTQFGLNTGGNTKAILMSLPPAATWN